MIIDEISENKISELLEIVNNICEELIFLGEDVDLGYKSIGKVKNILVSKNLNGFKNVKNHLMKDFRMIEDRQLSSDKLNLYIDKAYYCVSNNEVFHR